MLPSEDVFSLGRDPLDLVLERLRVGLELQPELDHRTLDAFTAQSRLDRADGGEDVL